MSKKIYFSLSVVFLFLVFMAPNCCDRDKLPDLIVDSITVTPANPTTGDQIEFTAVIKNSGEKASPVSVAAMRVGGETYPKEFDIPALNPGAVHTIQRVQPLDVAQNYRVTVYADYPKAVTESDEDNNEKYESFTVKKGAPDLIVKNLELVQDCKIKVTIANIGTAGVPASGYDLNNGAGIQMYRFDQPWGGIRLGAVDPSHLLMTPDKSVSWIWFPGAANLNLAPGTHTIRVVVDNNNAVVESDETNNSRTAQLTCKE